MRKKAEPAKDLVKGWITKWKDAPGIQGEISYTELSGMLSAPSSIGQSLKQ